MAKYFFTHSGMKTVGHTFRMRAHIREITYSKKDLRWSSNLIQAPGYNAMVKDIT